MADILISPLGRSPGAVSGVYFALKAQESIEIEKVVTVGTSHPDVVSAADDYLDPIFEEIGVTYDPIHIPGKELRKGFGMLNPYIALAELALKNARDDGYCVHVAVTGGRSGMGALMALATNLYGADHLWHLWVDYTIEEGGTINKLSGLIDPEEMLESPYLNPALAGDEAYEVVDLPFLDLRPLHDVLWNYRRTGQPPPGIDASLVRIFNQAGVKRFGDVFPAGMTFTQADRIVKLIEEYRAADGPEQAQLMVELGGILQEAGVIEPADRQPLIDLLNGQAAPEEMVTLMQQSRDRFSFWKWLGDNKDNIGVVTSVAALLLNGLQLFLKSMDYLP